MWPQALLLGCAAMILLDSFRGFTVCHQMEAGLNSECVFGYFFFLLYHFYYFISTFVTGREVSSKHQVGAIKQNIVFSGIKVENMEMNGAF